MADAALCISTRSNHRRRLRCVAQEDDAQRVRPRGRGGARGNRAAESIGGESVAARWVVAARLARHRLASPRRNLSPRLATRCSSPRPRLAGPGLAGPRPSYFGLASPGPPRLASPRARLCSPRLASRPAPPRLARPRLAGLGLASPRPRRASPLLPTSPGLASPHLARLASPRTASTRSRTCTSLRMKVTTRFALHSRDARLFGTGCTPRTAHAGRGADPLCSIFQHMLACASVRLAGLWGPARPGEARFGEARPG